MQNNGLLGCFSGFGPLFYILRGSRHLLGSYSEALYRIYGQSTTKMAIWSLKVTPPSLWAESPFRSAMQRRPSLSESLFGAASFERPVLEGPKGCSRRRNSFLLLYNQKELLKTILFLQV